MPNILIRGSGEVIETGLLTSLLNALLSKGFPIETLCGGKAECGKCLIRVHSGAGFLSPLRDREKRRLETLGAGADMRLACQCYTRGDIEIEVINRRKRAET